MFGAKTQFFAGFAASLCTTCRAVAGILAGK
jgi:hypothetical protein